MKRVHRDRRLAPVLLPRVAPAPEHLDEVRGLIDAELASICERPVPEEELTVAIGYLCGSMVLGLEDHGARMSRLAASLTAYGEITPISEIIARIRAVTAADLQHVANRIFGSAAVEVTVGPAR